MAREETQIAVVEQMLDRGEKVSLVFLLFLFSFSLHAQNATATLEPNRVEPGDTFSLRLTVSGATAQPEGVDFSPWSELLPQENVLSRSGWQKAGLVWSYKCTLIAFDSAVLQLPPLNVRLHLGKTVETNGVLLKVVPKAVSDDVDSMAPVRDIRREPTLWLDYWPWGAGALVLLVLLWRLLRRRRKPVVQAVPEAVAPPPVRETPAHELALQKIDALAKQKLWTKDELKTHYAELSLIVREYLQKRFAVSALESTTREILAALKPLNFPLNQTDNLRQLLELSDLTKYARTPPPPEFHEKSLHNARELVKATQQ